MRKICKIVIDFFKKNYWKVLTCAYCGNILKKVPFWKDFGCSSGCDRCIVKMMPDGNISVIKIALYF